MNDSKLKPMHRPIRPPTWLWLHLFFIFWQSSKRHLLHYLWYETYGCHPQFPKFLEISWSIQNIGISLSPWELVYCSLLKVEGYDGYVSVVGIICVICCRSKHSWIPLLQTNAYMNTSWCDILFINFVPWWFPDAFVDCHLPFWWHIQELLFLSS